MKTLEILSFDDFSDIFEINLNKQPNQIFTSTINRQIYKFTINTFIDSKTFIKIEKNGETIGQGFVKIGIDLTFLSTNEAGQFFFLKKTNSDLINFNWENFGSELGLFYGILKDNPNRLSELEFKYSLVENTGNLAVWSVENAI